MSLLGFGTKRLKHMHTYKNWFNDNLNERLKNPLLDYRVILNPYQFKESNFIDSCANTAKLISSSYDKKIYIGLSGGMDSEFVCRIFLENNIDFIPVIATFHDNSLESSYAFRFCKKHKLNPMIIEISEKDLVELFYHNIYKKLNGVGIYAIASLKCGLVVEQLNGVWIQADHIYGGDGIEKINQSSLYSAEWDSYNSVLCPNLISIEFFKYTPELLFSSVVEIDDEELTWAEFKEKKFNCAFRPKLRATYSEKTQKALDLIFSSGLISKPNPICSFGKKKNFIKLLEKYTL